MSKIPTPQEVIAVVREHFGLSLTDTIAAIKRPLHPAGLRDDLAGLTMQGMYSSGDVSQGLKSAPGLSDEAHCAATAQWAYLQADAMLAERGK